MLGRIAAQLIGLVLALGTTSPLEANPIIGPYQEIHRLDHRDAVFREHQLQLERFYRDAARDLEDGGTSITIYRYLLEGSEDFHTLCARLNLRPDTVATLNGFDHPDSMHGQESLLVPTVQAIFLATEPRTPLEALMVAQRRTPAHREITVSFGQDAVHLSVFLDDTFRANERTHFYRRSFRLPLENTSVTSYFGIRTHPITGRLSSHQGIDLAASYGDPVFAVGDGRVTAIEYDAVYGWFVLIDHAGGIQTLYGHLLGSIRVGVNTPVSAGVILGHVGDTGITTGSHLHFEIRKDGTALDPLHYFAIKRGSLHRR